MQLNRKLRRSLKAIGLSGTTTPEAANDIKNQYYRACAEAGELQYKIGQFQEALASLNAKLAKLNVAFSEVQAEERAAAEGEEQ